MDASDPIQPSIDLLWHGGRPHMGPGVRRDDSGLKSRDGAVQVVGVRALDLRGDDLADRSGRWLATSNAPSMSGASPLLRPLATVGPTSSMITCWRVPTLRFSRRAEIFCCCAINAFQRSCFTSRGTGLPSAFAGAPATGSYLKQPARSICGFVEPVEQ